MLAQPKPKGPWNKLARKYSKCMIQLYVGSPVIELDRHQYVQVEYFGSFGGPGPYPNVKVLGTVVLKDGQSVVNDPSTARRVTALAFLMLALRSEPVTRQMEKFAAPKKERTQAPDSLLNETTWYRKHQLVLCKYVPRHAFESFLRAFEDKLATLHDRAEQATRMLRLLSVLTERESIPAEHIKALERLYLQAQERNVQNTWVLLEIGKCAAQLSTELQTHRDAWAQNQETLGICERALQAWKTIASLGQQAEDRDWDPQYARATFEEIHTAGMQEIIDQRMSVYKVPLIQSTDDRAVPEEHKLTKTEMDHIVDSLPPLPTSRPWQPSRTKQVLAYVSVGVGMVVALIGIGLSILRIVGGGASFLAISQAIFFAVWLFILPGYLRRR